MPELSDVLAAHRGSGYVVAQAGFGKTHLIAEAVSRSTERQLVLTHTYAGVNALRRKMRELGVRDGAFRVDTIASWALRLSLSYPTTSGWTIDRPTQAHRMLGVLRKHALHPQLTLREAAEKYHAEFRYKGRPVGRRKLIGTTLLVKGLEFDHAIVLDAESLSRKELYVALTRGAKSLTVISSAGVLNPAD